MATLKLTLDKRRKYKDGRSPLILRLTADSISTSIHLGIKIHIDEWDEKKGRILKKHPHFQELNLHLKNTILKNEQKILEIEALHPRIIVTELKRLMLNDDEIMTFKKFADDHINNLQIQKRYGNAQSFTTALNKMVAFAGTQLQFSQIDYGFIKRLDNHLSSKGISANSIASYMRAIRVLLNSAGNLKYYDMENYPFKHFKIRTQKTASRAETIQTIQKIKSLKLKTSTEHFHARNVFLLIFSLIGISFMDLVLLKKSNYSNGRIIYKRRKTGKLYSVKVTPLVKELLAFYHSDSTDFLLPQFGQDSHDESRTRHMVNLGLKSTNRYLKQIGEQLELPVPLTTYVARYSWANIAKSNGYSKDLIAEALGHSYGNAVTGIYLEGYGNEVIDSANESIVSLL
jgi:integrase